MRPGNVSSEEKWEVLSLIGGRMNALCSCSGFGSRRVFKSL